MNNYDLGIIGLADSYKFSHWVQYPKNTTDVFSYIESRGCEGDWTKDLVFVGLQVWLKKYLSNPITMEQVNLAKTLVEAHGEPFNYDDWKYIVEKYNGYLPVTIKAVPEGSVIPLRNVLATIHTSDPRCFWLPSFLETAFLRSIWYPTSVATLSYNIKKIIFNYLKETSDQIDSLSFALHDFGARGVSSHESAELGGLGHLVNFKGSDTFESMLAIMQYYNTNEMPAYSIPAAEHSTITSWERDHEFEAYSNMIDQYAAPGKIFAVVSDSYNIYNAVENLWSKGGLFDRVKAAGARAVCRPDSGDPLTVPVKIIDLIAKLEGYTINRKGFKVLPDHIRVIQGDGITIDTIPKILENLKNAGYSTENLALGMGGGLLQHTNRDRLKFAQKCSAALVNGKWVDVFKSPVDDINKQSKKGRLSLVKDEQNNYKTIRIEDLLDRKEELETVFENGKIIKEYNFDEIRERANEYFNS